MKDIKTELEEYIKQLEKEQGMCTENENKLLSNISTGEENSIVVQADMWHVRTMVLREVIKNLNEILSDNTH